VTGAADGLRLRIDVFSAFPALLEGAWSVSLLGRARARGAVDLRAHDPRDHAPDTHRGVDDAPFGGGPGMVMTPGPMFAAVEAVDPPRPLLLLSPGGERFDQARARALAAGPGFSLLCGRYEGVDQRVADHLCDGELSIGDYVLAGGEVAALVVIECVTRLIPGVMGNEVSGVDESFGASGGPGERGATGESRPSAAVLEHPQYTRPAVFRGWAVPSVLRSGDHDRIRRWRTAAALRRTLARRPDLLCEADLTTEQRALLDEFASTEPDR